MSRLIQRPSPVPCAALGAEERLEEALGIFAPNALAGVENRNRRPAAAGLQIGGLVHIQAQGSTRGHGLDGVGYQVQQHLPQLHREAFHRTGRKVLPLHGNAARLNRPLLQLHHIVQQFVNAHLHRLSVFAIKAQSLPCDLRDPRKLLAATST